MQDRFAFRPHEKMREVLMDKNAVGPAVHYWMIRGGANVGNITVWEVGTVGLPGQGGEYIKTYGHYHVDALPETYRVLAGEGVAILQKRITVDDPTRLEDVRIVRLKAGDTLNIPAGYGHMVANVGTGFLVTIDDSPVAGERDSAGMPIHADYAPLKATRGFAYYIVEKEGGPALVKNRLYEAIENENLGGLPIIS